MYLQKRDLCIVETTIRVSVQLNLLFSISSRKIISSGSNCSAICFCTLGRL
ncbi:hypothetical protein HanXRQr2_Chr02g0081521 [Helianthus annuus]|uniref:Uncharacterized protein n=1 Tax=Helianthus annuus TaxID=4232 RepID=A0A9K3P1D6_HELAN|nr:hypothetical protein HanXRQr2_Chr02g0081521 [Helianthus annuus]